MYVQYYGISGFLVLLLDLWAIVSVINSAKSTGDKVLWILVILLLPVLGFIAWFFMGPRASSVP